MDREVMGRRPIDINSKGYLSVPLLNTVVLGWIPAYLSLDEPHASPDGSKGWLLFPAGTFNAFAVQQVGNGAGTLWEAGDIIQLPPWWDGTRPQVKILNSIGFNNSASGNSFCNYLSFNIFNCSKS